MRDTDEPGETGAVEASAGEAGAVEAGSEKAVALSPPPTLFTILPYIMLPMAMAVSDQTIVSTALPSIASSLGGVNRISWVIVASLVSGVAAAPVYGQLRDVFGSRRMMVIALSIYVTASMLCASAPSIAVLVFGRFLQGLGGGGLMTLSQAIIGETIPPRERAKYQGYLAAVVVSASVGGPILGGLLTTSLGWRSVFFINAPLGVIAMIVTLRTAARPVVAKAWSFDYPGLALFFSFIGPLLLGLDTLRDATGGKARAGVLLGVAVVALVGLIWQERRAFSPLLPVALLRQPTVWMSDVLAACHGAALVSMATLLPIYLHVMKGASASTTGMALLPLMLGIGSGSMLTGRTVSRTGYTAIFPSIGLSLATLFMLHTALVIDAWSRTEMFCWLLATGLSMGTIMGVVQVTVQSAAGKTSIGSAAASVQISRAIGAALGATITGAILFGALQFGDRAAPAAFAELFAAAHGAAVPAVSSAVSTSISAAFRAAFLGIAVFTGFGAAIAWNIPKRRL